MGKKPILTVAKPIIAMVIMNTGLRPIRSPIEPNKRDPIGLTTIPTPKVARLAKMPVLGSLEGKKSGTKTTAKVAKVRKSYHSKKVPKQVAIATFPKDCLSELYSKILILFNLMLDWNSMLQRCEKYLNCYISSA